MLQICHLSIEVAGLVLSHVSSALLHADFCQYVDEHLLL
jgi:hypothetical protein